MQKFPYEELDELYQEIILEHYRSPKNNRKIGEPDIAATAFNPFCGDELVLNIKLDGDGAVEDAGFLGQGCSISQASASMLTELVKGKSLQQVGALSKLFRAMMQGQDVSEEDLAAMGELGALQGVRMFPIRIKCALLAWSALEDGIEEHRSNAKKA